MATKNKKYISTPFSVLGNKITIGIAIRIGLVAAVIFLVPYLAYVNSWDYDKRKFHALANSVEELKDRFDMADRALLDWRYEETCRSSGTKFGPPVCSVSTNQGFYIKGEERHIQTIIDRYRLVASLSGDLFVMVSEDSSDKYNHKQARYTYEFEEINTGIECQLVFDIPEGATMKARFTCSDEAKNKWFPRNSIFVH